MLGLEFVLIEFEECRFFFPLERRFSFRSFEQPTTFGVGGREFKVIFAELGVVGGDKGCGDGVRLGDFE